ncbi:MAG: asparagine synthase, partial [Myxococcales bacterium]|nr:asparagine synthase [Myxococcales bacterium]
WVAGRPLGGADALAARFAAAGPDGVGDWPGDWALVARRAGDDRLWVAVDAFAGVPLFVRADVATTDPTSLRGPPDREGMRQQLAARFDDPWRTLYDGVWRVPAGHGGALGHPRDLRRIFVPRGGDPNLRAVLQRAVDERLPEGEVWLALSGGLDSSALAACLEGPRLRTTTNAFPGWTADERPFAHAVAARVGAPLVPVDSRGLDPFEVLDLLAPFPPVLVNHHLNLALMAPGRTLFTGFGGDEVVGHGFDVVRQRMAEGRPVRGLLDAVALAARYRHARASFPHELQRWLREAGGAWLRPPTAQQLRERRVARLTHPLLARSREEQILLARSRGTRLEMPFLDPRVAAAVIELPASVCCRRGRTRAHLRTAFAGELPRSILDRTRKADLSQSFHARFHEGLSKRLPLLGAVVEEGLVTASWVDRACDTDPVTRPEVAAELWRAAGIGRFLVSQ